MTKLPGITILTTGGTIGALWINYHLDSPNKADPKYVAMGKKEFRQALAYAIDFDAFRNIRTGGKPDLLIPRTASGPAASLASAIVTRRWCSTSMIRPRPRHCSSRSAGMPSGSSTSPPVA